MPEAEPRLNRIAEKAGVIYAYAEHFARQLNPFGATKVQVLGEFRKQWPNASIIKKSIGELFHTRAGGKERSKIFVKLTGRDPYHYHRVIGDSVNGLYLSIDGSPNTTAHWMRHEEIPEELSQYALLGDEYIE